MTDDPNADVFKDDLMTSAEFRVVREYLGLTGDALGQILEVDARTIRNWEAGKYLIPDGVRERIEGLEDHAAAQVGRYVDGLKDSADVGVIVYRSDAELWVERPDLRPFPARWHRAIIARVALEVPGLEIEYPSR